MGGNNSTRRVSFETDENDKVTVVKGIRLSENVISRMREPSKPQVSRTPPDPVTPQVPPPAPPSSADLPTPRPSSPLSHKPCLTPCLEVTAPCATPADPATPLAEPAAPSSPSLASPPLEEVVTPPLTVNESELRRKITEEVQKGLEEERGKTQHELNQWLERERARVKAQAHADAQAHVKDEVSRILASERAAALDSAQRAVLRDRVTAEEERLRTKLLAKQLEERDQQLRKQDAFYREQLNKLEERSTQSYKATNENCHKAVAEVNAKFRRYEISPVCADLQGQILNCYRENAGKTLLCSNLASLYLQCVNSAKQSKLRPGG